MQRFMAAGYLQGTPALEQQRAVAVRSCTARPTTAHLQWNGQPKLSTPLCTQLGSRTSLSQVKVCEGTNKSDGSGAFGRCSIRCEATSSESGNEKSDWRTDPVSQALHASKSLAQRLSDAAKVAGRWTSKNLPVWDSQHEDDEEWTRWQEVFEQVEESEKYLEALQVRSDLLRQTHVYTFARDVCAEL